MKETASNHQGQKRFFWSGSKHGRWADHPWRHFSGFSLLESLISLTLSLLILVSALEVMTQARKLYSRLQAEQEAALGAAMALEKIREDLEQAGTGIEGHRPQADSWPIKIEDSVITLLSGEISLTLASDIEAGQNSAPIIPWSGSGSKLKTSRVILFACQGQTDLVEITSISNNQLTVSPAFSSSFRASETFSYLLEKIEIYLDSKQSILRRRVNSTSGQPLLEGVRSFKPAYDPESNLVSIRLKTGLKKEKTYELFFYPKNTSKT
ncbi:MAG: hypothetical protein WBK32_01740 [Candidatus Saccharicenans sp.]|jgi:type II secretory pathway pseudopilin PulG|nr:hypothetical protein [Candidatus Saccharicenans sp.]